MLRNTAVQNVNKAFVYITDCTPPLRFASKPASNYFLLSQHSRFDDHQYSGGGGLPILIANCRCDPIIRLFSFSVIKLQPIVISLSGNTKRVNKYRTDFLVSALISNDISYENINTSRTFHLNCVLEIFTSENGSFCNLF